MGPPAAGIVARAIFPRQPSSSRDSSLVFSNENATEESTLPISEEEGITTITVSMHSTTTDAPPTAFDKKAQS